MIVSVVIPTVLRSSLTAAIESVRSQLTHASTEVIVVVDKNQNNVSDQEQAAASLADIVLFTGGRKGAPAARNLGVSAASGEWIAFLDDDDVWEPGKIEDQLAVAPESTGAAQLTVISGQVRQRGQDGTMSRAIPDRTYQGGNGIADYLFHNRKASVGRESIFTSTLLVTRHAAKTIRWDESLKRHQDWDWLLRAEAAGAQILQISSPVSLQSIGSAKSISASADWQASLDWCRGWRAKWRRRTYVDFVVAQPLRYALQARSAKGALRCLEQVFWAARLPNLSPLMIGGAGILPRKKMEALMLYKTKKHEVPGV